MQPHAFFGSNSPIPSPLSYKQSPPSLQEVEYDSLQFMTHKALLVSIEMEEVLDVRPASVLAIEAPLDGDEGTPFITAAVNGTVHPYEAVAGGEANGHMQHVTTDIKKQHNAASQHTLQQPPVRFTSAWHSEDGDDIEYDDPFAPTPLGSTAGSTCMALAAQGVSQGDGPSVEPQAEITRRLLLSSPQRLQELYRWGVESMLPTFDHQQPFSVSIAEGCCTPSQCPSAWDPQRGQPPSWSTPLSLMGGTIGCC